MITPTPNTNTSASGGYLLPTPDMTPIQRFIQTVLVGVSALPGDLVRPKWQSNPPKQPDIDVNWLGFYLNESDADFNAYVGIDQNNNNVFQRMKALKVQCSFYGPLGYEIGDLVRDNFQISQNREALQKCKMDYVSSSSMTRAPDLVNEHWVNRWEMTIYLRAETLRVYPILTFVSSSGTLYALGDNGVKTIPLVAKERA